MATEEVIRNADFNWPEVCMSTGRIYGTAMAAWARIKEHPDCQQLHDKAEVLIRTMAILSHVLSDLNEVAGQILSSHKDN